MSGWQRDEELTLQILRSSGATTRKTRNSLASGLTLEDQDRHQREVTKQQELILQKLQEKPAQLDKIKQEFARLQQEGRFPEGCAPCHTVVLFDRRAFWAALWKLASSDSEQLSSSLAEIDQSSTLAAAAASSSSSAGSSSSSSSSAAAASTRSSSRLLAAKGKRSTTRPEQADSVRETHRRKQANPVRNTRGLELVTKRRSSRTSKT